MKITPKSADPVKLTRPDATEARMPTPAAAAPEQTESVQLSSLSTKLAARASAGDAPVNMENVQRIKTAIQNGEFTVNAQAVADKLIEIERGFH